MEYNFREIEKKWQQKWVDNKTYKVVEDESKQKFYVLNMFPYPSGAGLHVGHPLGYIASDIYARYKRLQGFNVLNPMGYDAYGLPAEQYAIQTGQHPAVTTAANIARYREQLDKIGFSFVPANRAIITGHSGLSRRCSTASIAIPARRHSQSANWLLISKHPVQKVWMWLAVKNFILLLKNGSPSQKRNSRKS